MAGVLKSWALPKGPSMNPADRRLAVMVDDHSLAFVAFEGIIPQGQYGAGAVVVWDAGTYRLLEGHDPVRAVEAGRLAMEFEGNVLRGRFTLFRMQERDERNWLLVKKKDAYSRTDWVLTPALTRERERMLCEQKPPCKPHSCAGLGLPMR